MIRALLLNASAVIAFAAPARAEAPNVVADIAPVHALTAQVMQGVGEPALLMPQGSNPHGHALRPSEARALSNADLVVWVGPDLTPSLARSIGTLAEGAVSLPLLDQPGTQVLEFRNESVFAGEDHGHHEDHADHAETDHEDHEAHAEDDHADHADHAAHADEDHADHADEDHAEEAHEDHAEDDHADHEANGDADHADHGHDHAGVDPHAWLDPQNGIAWLDAIAEALSAQDPANAEAYRANADAAQQAIRETETRIADRLAAIEGVPFIVFHDAYQYFETRFGLRAVGALSLADGASPNAAQLAEIRDAVQAQGIRCALAEPQYDPDLIAAVFEGLPVETAIVDPLGASLDTGPGFYLELLEKTADGFGACG